MGTLNFDNNNFIWLVLYVSLVKVIESGAWMFFFVSVSFNASLSYEISLKVSRPLIIPLFRKSMHLFHPGEFQPFILIGKRIASPFIPTPSSSSSISGIEIWDIDDKPKKLLKMSSFSRSWITFLKPVRKLQEKGQTKGKRYAEQNVSRI